MSFHHGPLRFFVLAAALTLFAVVAGAESPVDLSAAEEGMGTLVTAEWLSEHLDDPDLVVLDCAVTMMPDEAGGMASR